MRKQMTRGFLILLLASALLVSCSSSKVKELTNENSELRAKNEALQKENTELRAQFEELKGKLAKIEDKEKETRKAREALRALQRLDARCTAGISPVDFPPALGEAIFQVTPFLESPEAAKMPQFTESIEKALRHYKVIGDIMDSYMDNVIKGSLAAKLKSSYGVTRSIYTVEQLKDIAGKTVMPEASKEVEKAKNLLQQ